MAQIFDASLARDARPKSFDVSFFGHADDESTEIWRYVSFAKLLSLLENRALYFARADTVGDRFEGSMAQANLALRPLLFEAIPEPERERIAGQLSMIRRAQLVRTFLNCWTAQTHESVALWRLYVRDHDGVAIRSTVGRLKAAIGEYERPILLGRVRYLDYTREPVPENNLYAPWFHKRQAFRAELEFRGVLQFMDWTERNEPIAEAYPKPGVHVPVDLATLIAEIRLSPTSRAWFVDLVSAVLQRWGVDVEVRRSDLLGDPVY